MGSIIPEIGEVRTIKHRDGSTERIKIVSVYPSNCGPRAYSCRDSNDKIWVFAFPAPEGNNA